MVTGYLRKSPTPDRFFAVLAGFEQPTAGFAAGELVNLWYSVAGDNVQSMSAKLWIGL
jgi:hypothetical protein